RRRRTPSSPRCSSRRRSSPPARCRTPRGFGPRSRWWSPTTGKSSPPVGGGRGGPAPPRPARPHSPLTAPSLEVHAAPWARAARRLLALPPDSARRCTTQSRHEGGPVMDERRLRREDTAGVVVALEGAHDADVAAALNAIDPPAAARVLGALPFDLAVRALNQPELDRPAHGVAEHPHRQSRHPAGAHVS